MGILKIRTLLKDHFGIKPMQSDVLQLTAQILSSRQISSREQRRMSALLSKSELHESERVLINRIFYGVRHGLLTTVD